MHDLERIDRPIGLHEVDAIEKIMLEMPQVELEVIHHFYNGVYARELHIPAGITLTGAIHHCENLNVLSQGEICVLVGDEMKHIKAPFAVMSPAGTKRIATTLTDCIWTTFFSTNETDPEKIVSEFTSKTTKQYLEHCENLRIKGE